MFPQHRSPCRAKRQGRTVFVVAQGLNADGFIHQGIVVVGGHGGQHLVDGILQRGVALLHRDADVDILVADLEVTVAAAEVQQREVGVGDQCWGGR